MDLTSERPLQTAFKSALGRFVTRITCFLNVTNGAIVIHTQRLKSDPGGNLLS
ncbi:methyl-accepting chemotaxis protein II [Yersinia pestis biovar Orientalis str. F1991016]|nr:methyl-accepting chemotaxis protein II [Yersinia pestis biovar Orientalis str. F1991016]